MFKLRIQTGDMDAADLAEILGRVAKRLAEGYPGEDVPARAGDLAPIRDLNGNTVGRWEWTA